MNKKICLLIAVPLFMNNASAKFYGGFGLGLNNSQVNTVFSRDPGGNAPTGDYHSLKGGYNSFLAGLFGGWMYKTGVLTAGVEIGGNLDTLNDKIFRTVPQAGITESFKVKNSGALETSLRFGVYANQTSLFYLKPGIVWSKLKTSFLGTDSISAPGTNFQDRLSSSRSTGAFKMAVGYEGFVTSCISLRGELSHTFSTNHKLHIPNYPVQTYSSEQTTVKFRTSQTGFKIGLSYHIG